VALVHVIDRWLFAKFVEKFYAADTEENLLVDTHILVTAIDAAADVAVMGFIGRNIGVEQIECSAANLEAPCLCKNFTLCYINRNDQVIALSIGHFFNRKAFRVLKRVVFGLPSILVEVLAEVALFVKQGNANKINAKVAGRFQVVSGKNTESARINSHTFMNAEFSTEIGNRVFHQFGSVFGCPSLLVVHVGGKTCGDRLYFFSVLELAAGGQFIVGDVL